MDSPLSRHAASTSRACSRDQCRRAGVVRLSSASTRFDRLPIRARLHHSRRRVGAQPRADRRTDTLQRPLPRRVPQHGVVSHASRGSCGHRGMAVPLQHRPPPFEPRLFDTRRIQSQTDSQQRPDPGGCCLVITGPQKPGRSSGLLPQLIPARIIGRLETEREPLSVRVATPTSQVIDLPRGEKSEVTPSSLHYVAPIFRHNVA